MKKLLFLTVLLFVSACGPSTSPYFISARSTPENIPESNGFLVGSFAREDIALTSFSFRSLDMKTKDRLVFDGELVNDYKDNRFVYSLPEGNYEFYQYTVTAAVMGGTRTWSPREDFSIPFKIERGKVAYIGNIKGVGLTGKNIFGITIPAGGYFVISDQSMADLPVLKANHPFLNGKKIVVAVPKSGNVAPELVQFK